VVTRSEVIDRVGDSEIGGTYVGNPVACAAANAVLQVIEEEGLVERAEEVGKTIRGRWEEAARDIPEVGEVRGLGAMVGVEFVTDRDSKEPNHDIVSRITGETTSRGVVSVSCGIYKSVLRHLMPLVITDEQLVEGLEVMIDTASRARRERGTIPEGEVEGP
jgi:4-aminobutyrate aminotransferase/(S)-3-amino-2-methylpropionate transaminase